MKFLKFLTSFFYVLMIIFFFSIFVVTGYFIVVLILWGIFGVVSDATVLWSFVFWSVVFSGMFVAVLACNLADEIYAKKFKEKMMKKEERKEIEK